MFGARGDGLLETVSLHISSGATVLGATLVGGLLTASSGLSVRSVVMREFFPMSVCLLAVIELIVWFCQVSDGSATISSTSSGTLTVLSAMATHGSFTGTVLQADAPAASGGGFYLFKVFCLRPLILALWGGWLGASFTSSRDKFICARHNHIRQARVMSKSSVFEGMVW